MFGAVPEVQPDVHPCAWPDCGGVGEHRAPRSRDAIDSFHWFCLEHARAYNKAWNYYEGMSDCQVEADLRTDTTWNRPSWPFAGKERPRVFKWSPPGIDDFGGAFGNPAGDPDNPDTPNDKGPAQPYRPYRPDTPQAQAMAIFDLTPPVGVQGLKRRYKELVKRYHPDANGGDKQAEEKFKQISLAYAILIEETFA